MAEAKKTQPSFTAGELDPALYGRKDLARYQVGARRIENCILQATGGVANRPGLRLVGEVKNSAQIVRLKKFEAAGDEAFILETGEAYMRPIYRGANVLSGGLPYEIVTPYQQADLDALYLEQSNDVATITRHTFGPRELRRLGPTNWTLSTITFAPQIAAPTGLTAVATEGYDDYGDDKMRVKPVYRVSAVSASGEESLPSANATTTGGGGVGGDEGTVLGYDKNWIDLNWSVVSGADVYRVYKRENGLYGFIGETPNSNFRDTNFSPSFADAPQKGSNPFTGAGNQPAIVTFVQQRRGFAATANNPQQVKLSQSGNFNNMGVSSPAKDDDAITFTIAAERKQDIYHILALEKGMIVFTRSGEWKVQGREGDILTPSSVLPEPQPRYGSSKNLKPLVVGDQVIFASRTNAKVYEFAYSLDVDRYKAEDKTILSRHLFRDRRIVAWDYSKEPDGLIWCVMDDGTALTLTYLKDQDVWGWSRHVTDGRFLDVCVVPEATRDVPYFIVQRRVGGVLKKYIEFLEDREFSEIEECFFVDSGLSLDVPLSVLSLTFGETTTISVLAHGLSDGDTIEIRGVQLLDGENEEVFLDEAGNTLNRRWLVTVLDVDTITLRWEHDLDPYVAGQDLNTAGVSGSYYSGGGVLRRAVLSVGGLQHLAGRRVAVLADGNVIPDMIVAVDGTLTFDRPYARVHAGLPYSSELTTLDLVNAQVDDTGRVKSTAQMFARLDRTRGVKVGVSSEEQPVPDLVEMFSRSFEDYDDPTALTTGIVEVDAWSASATEQFVTIRQDYPLPMNVLGITSDIDYGGS